MDALVSLPENKQKPHRKRSVSLTNGPKQKHHKKIETIQITARGWTIELELMAKKIAEDCAANRWIYNTFALNNNFYFQWFNIAIGIFSCLVGGAIFIQTNTDWRHTWIIILIGISQVAIAFCSLLNLQFDFSGMAKESRQASSDYMSLQINIEKTLLTHKYLRQDALPYIDWITKEYSRLQRDSPDADPTLAIEYKKQNIPGAILNNEVYINPEIAPDETDSDESEKNIPNGARRPSLPKGTALDQFIRDRYVYQNRGFM